MADVNWKDPSGHNVPLDTRSEDVNGDHRLVVVLGDPSSNTGLAPVDGTAGLKTSVSSVTVASTIRSGKVTVATAGTRVQFPAGALTSGVVIAAPDSNPGIVYVGDSTVDSTNGFQLDPGDSVPLEIDALDSIWVDAASNASVVTFLGS